MVKDLNLNDMKYEIYSDESCLEAIFDKDAHRYAVIGGVWIPASYRQELKQSINSIKEKYGIRGELKWNKVSPQYFNLYKEFIDLFIQSEYIRFRAIVVDASKINNEVFNDNNAELGFYKFYYQLIQHWLFDGNEYAIFLDHKINAYKSRVHELGRILNYATNAVITNVQALPSEESVIIQLADVLTGIVAAKFNSRTVSVAKLALISRIEDFLGHEIAPTVKSENKFNVFNINLRQGW